MKYRIYRVEGSVEYKDVEATNISEAYAHHIDPKEGFYTTDSGYIFFACLDDDFSKEKTLSDLRKEKECYL